MKLVDANVLLYAVNEDSPHHAVALRWLNDVLSGYEPVGFAWTVLLAFLRLATKPALFPTPLTGQQALDVVENWLGAGPSVVLDPTARHLAVLRGMLEQLGTAANLVPDAHLAAMAVEHGAEIVSFDTDFARFPGVRWRTPD